MIVTVIMVFEYGALKTCLAFSDEDMARSHYDGLLKKHGKHAVFKAKCKLDDLTGLNLGL